MTRGRRKTQVIVFVAMLSSLIISAFITLVCVDILDVKQVVALDAIVGTVLGNLAVIAALFFGSNGIEHMSGNGSARKALAGLIAPKESASEKKAPETSPGGQEGFLATEGPV